MKKMFCALCALFVCNSAYACDEGTYADYPPCRFERVLIFQQPCPQQQEMKSNQMQSSPPVQGTPVNSLSQQPQPQQALHKNTLDDERIRRLEEQVNRLESTITVLTNTVEKLTEYKNSQSQQMPEPKNDFKKKANSVPSLKNM